MTVQEGLELIQNVINQGHLSKVQLIVFQESWAGKSYQEIAGISGYEVSYITDVGHKLWQMLSKTFGQKVTKNNFQAVIKQQKQRQGRKTFVNPSTIKKVDWGDAIDVSVFYGRTTELKDLTSWVVEDNCRLIALLGMGGVGKTALAAKLAEQIQSKFDYTIWRSLRNAPPCETLLAELIKFFSREQEVSLPETIEAQISCLMDYLAHYRCLLILDNAESILCEGKLAGSYRQGYQGYGQLLRRMSEQRHDSCLVLTSREKPVGLAAKEGKTSLVRSHQLTGLGYAEAEPLLQAKGLVKLEDEFKKLVEQYTGNPLALNIAATTINYLFNGDITRFLEQNTVIFGEIWALLEQQFSRLSILEQQVMRRMMKASPNWIKLPELQANLPTHSHRELLEAINSLQQRSLIETDSSSYIQHSMILEYMLEKARGDRVNTALGAK